MGTGYRAILRLSESDSAVDVAERELYGWLAEKKRRGSLSTAEWDGVGRHELGEGVRLDVIYAPDARDGSKRHLYRFAERNAAGAFTVSVYALSTPNARDNPESLVVEAGIDGRDIEESVDLVDPPRLMRQILSGYEATDSKVRLTGSPELVRFDEVGRIFDAITDDRRTTSVIVAASPGRGHEDRWRAVVEALTKESVGVAATFVVDEDALAKLNASLPSSLQVTLGSVRTYAPAVDLTSPEDGLRHRILFPGTFARSLSGTKVARPLVKTHARSTRLRFLERDLPSDIRRGMEVLFRAETSAQRTWEVARRVAQPEVKRGTSTLLSAPIFEESRSFSPLDVFADVVDALTEVVRRWVGKNIEPVSVEAIAALDDLLERNATELAVVEEQVEATTSGLESNEQQLREMRKRVEDVSLDLTVADDRIRELTHETTQLRQRLVDAGRAKDAFVAPLENVWDPPDDVLGLISRITAGPDTHKALEFVEFTGSEDVALEVDLHEKTPRYAHAFWDYVHVLYDYAAGKKNGSIKCGVHTYLKTDALIGHKCSPERHAPTESETVLSRKSWREQRILPVPNSVEASGQVLMDAHFKPTWRDAFAPRMHYYDDTDGTGKIYIGYLGRHLTNTKS